MKKVLLKELRDEAKAMREGRSVIEEMTGREAAEAEKSFVNVKISKSTFARISKLAKAQKKPVAEIIEEKFIASRAQ